MSRAIGHKNITYKVRYTKTQNLHLGDSPDCFEHEKWGGRRNHVRPVEAIQGSAFPFNATGVSEAPLYSSSNALRILIRSLQPLIGCLNDYS